MLTKTEFVAHLAIAALLIAGVLIFTDRNASDWWLAAGVFGGVVVGDLLGRLYRSRRSRR